MSAPGNVDERPLTARSVVASLLLGTQPPWLPTVRLVRGAALFGIADGTVRTALSRMAAAGEVASDGAGYALVGPLLERQQRQTRSRRAETAAWDGSWRMAVVESGARPAADRAALRLAVRSLRLAEAREGCFLRPDNLAVADRAGAAVVVGEQCRWFTCRPDEEPVALAARLWDLTGWTEGAADLVRRLGVVGDDLRTAGPEALADGFVLSAAVLRHLQADPLLPAPLLPAAWPGADLRTRYDAFDRAYRAVLDPWLRT